MGARQSRSRSMRPLSAIATADATRSLTCQLTAAVKLLKQRIKWSFTGSWLDRKLANIELPLFFVCLIVGTIIFSRAVGLTALLMQQAVQSYVVYRSTACEQQHPRQRGKRDPMLTHDPSLNVLRSVAGTLMLALIDARLTTHLPNVLGKEVGLIFATVKLVCCSFVGYWTIVVSEYMVHRFIWHGHWMRSRLKTPRFFTQARFHYVHHYLAHHKHAIDPETKARMKKGMMEPHDPDRKHSIEEQFKSRTQERSIEEKVLECSNHGFTIGTWSCRLSTISLYFVGPTGFTIIMHLMRRDWLGASVHLLTTALPVYMAVQHHAFHSSREALLLWAKERVFLERWFWASEAMFRKYEEHKKHHYSLDEHSDTDFCGALPYGHLILIPIWQTW